MTVYTLDNKEYIFDRIKFNKIFSQKAKSNNISLSTLETSMGSELLYSPSQIHSWRMGKSQPTESSLKDISEQLGCLVEDLLSERCIYNGNFYGIEYDNENFRTIKVPKDISMTDLKSFLCNTNSYLRKKLAPFFFTTQLLVDGQYFLLYIQVQDGEFTDVGEIIFNSQKEDDSKYWRFTQTDKYPINTEKYSEQCWESLSFLITGTFYKMFD